MIYMKCEICGHSGQLGNGTHTCGGVAVTEKKGMSIIDAVKSGKNFRRPGGAWLADYSSITISKESILATDWEIEERKIEITESEFDAICMEVYGHTSYPHLKKRLFDK